MATLYLIFDLYLIILNTKYLDNTLLKIYPKFFNNNNNSYKIYGGWKKRGFYLNYS